MSKTNDCSVSSLFNKMRRKILDMSVLSEISSNILIAEMIRIRFWLIILFYQNILKNKFQFP